MEKSNENNSVAKGHFILPCDAGNGTSF